jgi:hypothetical protein
VRMPTSTLVHGGAAVECNSNIFQRLTNSSNNLITRSDLVRPALYFRDFFLRPYPSWEINMRRCAGRNGYVVALCD